MTSIPPLPTHPFWIFSSELYAQASVQAICLSLQDRCGANVNLLLFCCWLGIKTYRPLELIELRSYLFTVEHWHLAITQPLRQLRKTLKTERFAGLYTAALETELCAEQSEQQFLTDKLPPLSFSELPLEQQALNTVHNLKNYTRLLEHTFTQKDYALLTQLLVAVFPNLPIHNLQALARTQWRSH